MNTRIYIVTAVIGASDKSYLVDATSQAQARNHVAKKHIEAKVASGKDVAAHMAKGVPMEAASDQPATGEQPTLTGVESA